MQLKLKYTVPHQLQGGPSGDNNLVMKDAKAAFGRNKREFMGLLYLGLQFGLYAEMPADRMTGDRAQTKGERPMQERKRGPSVCAQAAM
jgi:hypothetical protein